MAFADLHCHLLPGLDDGARSLADALEHARRLAADGVHDVACTPPVKSRAFPGVALEELAPRRRALQAELDAAGIDVRLHPGGELAHQDALRLSPRELRLIAQGPAGGRWLLLECPFRGLDAAFSAAAERLLGLGFGLVLAHPERAADVLVAGRSRLEALRSAGALLQVNVCSLRGSHGLAVQATAAAFVRSGAAFCLASDGHPGSRDHTLALGVPLLLRAGATREHAQRLTEDNPRLLLRSGVPAVAVDDLARIAA